MVIASKLVLPKEVKVTRRSIMEYAQALRSRYFGASKEEKGKMLDEFTQVTGLHRKAANIYPRAEPVALLRTIQASLDALRVYWTKWSAAF